MDEDVKKRVLEKLKKGATDWHQKEMAEEMPNSLTIDATEEDSVKQELSLIRELKKVIVDSSLDRKSVYLSALASPEQMLERGRTPPNLPDVVRGLLKKDELKNSVLDITKKYRISGKSYYYLWGLDDERAGLLY
jgi:hypothetical protein